MTAAIYCWVNQHYGADVLAVAMDANGHVLAEHVSSTRGWARHDIGVTSGWKHDIYRAAHPDGYELIWIEEADVMTHPGLVAAMALNQARAADEDRS